MSEATSTGDELDRASNDFWHSADLTSIENGIEPLRADESFVIDDLSDEEWDEFLMAIRD